MQETEVAVYGARPDLVPVNGARIEDRDQALKTPEEGSVIILRQEPADFIFRNIRQQTGTTSGRFDRAYGDAWEASCAEVVRLLSKAYHNSPETENAVLHVWRMDQLKPGIEKKLGDRFAVCTDPVMERGSNMIPFGLSRKYLPGGRQKDNHTHRPGYGSLQDQVGSIRGKYDDLVAKQGGHPFQMEVVEDDFYGGPSLQSILKWMKTGEVPVGSVIASFVLNKGDTELPVKKVEGIVRYDPRTNLDLEDFRDFAPYGANGAGLVISKPENSIAVVNGATGDIYYLMRAPYVYPFVDPHERANIPTSEAVTFSKEMHRLNKQVYTDLTGHLGEPIQLGQVDPYFRRTIDTYYGLSPETPMEDVCSTIIERFDSTMEEVFGDN